MFYHPLLKPGEHYLPVSMHHVRNTVAWCASNDRACERIARRARTTMQCVLNLDVMFHYLWGVLQHIHKHTFS